MRSHEWIAAEQARASVGQARGITPKQIRLIYLVPADKVENSAYTAALETAGQHLQIWYRNEMGNGKTFALHSPVVEVYTTPHDADWYAATQNGTSDFFLWFYFNTIDDGYALTGGQWADPDNVWVLYIDADPDCGQIGGGGRGGPPGLGGDAVLPANDFRGLVGEANIPQCVAESPDTAGICRWVGGLGHELGHALSLPHPPGCDLPGAPPSCFTGGYLLWLGFRSYPNAVLHPDDVTALDGNLFFEVMSLPTDLPLPCACGDGFCDGNDDPENCPADCAATTTTTSTTTTSTTTTTTRPAVLCGGSPLIGCKGSLAGKSQLQIKLKASDPSKNQLKFKYNKGAATVETEFGDPVSSSPQFSLCVWDSSASPQPLIEVQIGPGGTCGTKPCWKTKPGKSHQYKNKGGNSDGVGQVKIKADGAPDKSQIQVKAKGTSFAAPTLPLTPTVTAQFIVDDGGIACWEVPLSTPTRNDAGRFKAKGP